MATITLGGFRGTDTRFGSRDNHQPPCQLLLLWIVFKPQVQVVRKIWIKSLEVTFKIVWSTGKWTDGQNKSCNWLIIKLSSNKNIDNSPSKVFATCRLFVFIIYILCIFFVLSHLPSTWKIILFILRTVKTLIQQ